MTLQEILKFKRPAGSTGEKVFVNKLLEHLRPYGGKVDDYGNLWVTVGLDPVIMWSCHTDTVHHSDGIQTPVYAEGKIHSPGGDCLGADDSAGIWVMLQMIHAGKFGLYIFHRDEEIGGLGSTWIAKHCKDQLTGIKAAIALDRKGYTSVITHQGGRTCSDAFANSLAFAIGGGFKIDDTGLFTDTANYTDIIGECSNLSVGYFGAHTDKESLDEAWLIEFAKAMIDADFSDLEFSRKPGASEARSYRYWEDDFSYNQYKRHGATDLYEENSIAELCWEDPDLIASFLVANNFTRRDIVNYSVLVSLKKNHFQS